MPVPCAGWRRNDFESGQTDIFHFEERNVGNLQKIRIGEGAAVDVA